MAELKLISICMFGRDDNYMPDFMYRITTTINCIARNLHQLGRLDDVELVITDWGSVVPMAESLIVSEQAKQICRFLYISPTLVEKVQGGKRGFHISLACNAAVRRALGSFILTYPADTFITMNSMESLLRVCDGSLAVRFNVKEALMLLPRFQVPWQFVNRQPELNEWDRYILINTAELTYESANLLPVFSGAGALLMHRNLWHEARGLDERYGGWGFQDNDLGLRMSQKYPWLSLSTIGLNLYHMEHLAVGARVTAVRNRNPPDCNSKIEINDEGWGMGNWKMEEHRIQDNTLRSIATKCERSSAAEDIPSALGSNQLVKKINRSITPFLRSGIVFDDVELLFFLAWYSTYRNPRHYLEFGIRRGYAAAVVGSSNPGAEIYGIDQWHGVVAHDSSIVYVAQILRSKFGHYGYQRFLNGDIRTAVRRLKCSFVGEFVLDLVLLREEMLGAGLNSQVLELLPCVAPGGALVISTETSGNLEAFWPEWHRLSPHSRFFISSTRRTGMILKDESEGGNADGILPIVCSLDMRPVLRQINPVRIVCNRVFKAVCQPNRYLEFSKRLVERVLRTSLEGRESRNGQLQ